MKGNIAVSPGSSHRSRSGTHAMRTPGLPAVCATLLGDHVLERKVNRQRATWRSARLSRNIGSQSFQNRLPGLSELKWPETRKAFRFRVRDQSMR
jgi:hypothetical protein